MIQNKRKYFAYDTNELIYKTETDSQTDNKFLVTKGEGGERDESAIWDQQMQTAIYKRDKQYCPTCKAQGTIFNIL